MAYSNILLDVAKLFDKMKVHTVENPPLTKKKKLPNIKKVDAPYGAVISLRKTNKFRGLVTKVIEDDVEDNCSKYFLNQITCIISLGAMKNINVFIFKTSFKIVGCKDTETAEEVIMLLWDEYIKPLRDCYQSMDNEPPNFTFETVMTNVDFSLGFMIDRKNLNTLLNSDKYTERIKASRFQTTDDTNVNVQFHTEKPKDYFYWRLVDVSDVKSGTKKGLKGGKGSATDGEIGWIVDKVDDIKYSDKKKKKKPKHTTFLVFQSSKIILSARYQQNMGKDYDYFLDIINNNRKSIEEKVDSKRDAFSF